MIPSTDNVDFGPNTTKYQDHIVCSRGYKLTCLDKQNNNNKPYKTLVKKLLRNFFNDMTKESKFNKPLVMSKKDYEDCKKSTKC